MTDITVRTSAPPDSEISVRTGTPLDIHPVMRLALAACEENGLTDPDPERLLQEIWPALHLEGGIIGVIGDGPTLEAAILLRVDCMWYSRTKTLLERAIFVHPDHRKSKVGRAKMLCEFAKKRPMTYLCRLLLAYSLLSERKPRVAYIYVSLAILLVCILYIMEKRGRLRPSNQ